MDKLYTWRCTTMWGESGGLSLLVFMYEAVWSLRANFDLWLPELKIRKRLRWPGDVKALKFTHCTEFLELCQTLRFIMPIKFDHIKWGLQWPVFEKRYHTGHTIAMETYCDTGKNDNNSFILIGQLFWHHDCCQLLKSCDTRRETVASHRKLCFSKSKTKKPLLR